MEGILPILMVIISILSVISKAQKKDAGKKKAFFPPADPVIEGKKPESKPAFVSAPMPAQPAAPAAPRMNEEGKDACHEYMLPDLEQQESAVPENSPDVQQARELVRGIILSEILTRPQPRGCGRRRA